MSLQRILVVLISIFLIIILVSFLAYMKAFFGGFSRTGNPYQLLKGEQYLKANEKMHTLVREFEALPYEQVYIKSNDGTKLAGRYYHVADGAILHIQCHGYHGTALRDFCGGNKLAREA